LNEPFLPAATQEVIHAAFRICGIIGPGERPSFDAKLDASFHLDGLLRERQWKSESRLAYALACRLAPEYRVKLPWRIRLTMGCWV
jgi:hypothetical protein